MSARPPARGRETGSVAAETAITLPVVVLVLAAVLVTAGAAVTQVRCADAARAAARTAALGEDLDAVRATALVVLDGASVDVRRDGSWVVVRVRRAVGWGGWWGDGLVASAEARGWVEPGAVASAVGGGP